MPNPTSHDLARACGVSQGTVDRALHDRPGISARTRERVLREAARRGYVPHAVARSLATGDSHLIGLVLFGLSNQFTGRLIRAIDEAARSQGCDLLVAFSNQDPELECRHLKRFLERRVDGLALFPVGHAREELRLAALQKTPVVTLFNRPDNDRVNYLRLNERAAMRQLAARLARRKCRRIVHVTVPVPSDRLADGVRIRQRAFLDAARSHRLDCAVCDAIPSEETLRNCDAVVCHNDDLALRVLRRLPARLRRPPLVTGFDGVEGVVPDERLAATFAIPYDGMAREAVRLIRERRFAATKIFDVEPLWNSDLET